MILIVLVILAGIAGVVARSSSRGAVAELRGLVSHQQCERCARGNTANLRTFTGRTSRAVGLNGAVKIETSDTKTAEVYIERTASSQEALDRRKVTIEADANSLRIRG